VWLLCLFLVKYWVSAQQVLTPFSVDGFNMTQSYGNLMDIHFHSLDLATSQYTLKLTAVYEGVMVNGRVMPNGINQIAGFMYTATPYMAPNNYYNTIIKGTNTPPNKSFLANLVINNTYWLQSSKKNVCPDINGRYCVKSQISFNYQQALPNTMLIFVWQLTANQVVATSMNPFATTPQVLNNLGFLTVETTTTNVDALGTKPTQTLPVKIEIRTDNITTNGIWVIYNLGAPNSVNVIHDPIFGINQNNGGTTFQIVTTALSIGIVLVFLIILGCSIYIYHGNTKQYYLKLRTIQDNE